MTRPPTSWTGRSTRSPRSGAPSTPRGLFTTVKEAGSSKPNLARSNIFAFDAATGKISTTFVPTIDGEVNALLPAADGRSLYIGGAFLNVNGSASRSLARLNVSDGKPTAGFACPDVQLHGPRHAAAR